MRLHEIIQEGNAPTPPVDISYQGAHGAPDKESGAPLHDLTGNGVYPDDVYGASALRHYCTDLPSDGESYAMVQRLRGHPNRPVTIYRSVPKSLAKPKINRGDWVAISSRYAVEHGRANLRNDFRVLSKTVFARDLFTAGDCISEWGYDPQPFDQAAEADLRARRQARIDALTPEQRATHDAKMAKFRDPKPGQD